MNNTHPAPCIVRLGIRAARLVAPVFVTACTVPGMQMGETARDNSNPGGAASSDVSARADVFPVNAKIIAKLANEQRALSEMLREASTRQLPSGKKAAPDDAYRYRIGPQDVLRITVWNHPELTNPSGTANELSGRVVNSDGTFFFPFAGKVPAAGKTVEEIREYLARALGPYLKNPQIDVSVLQYRSQRVFVAGEVARPGAVQITDVPMSITDAIAAAGGPTPGADYSEVTVTRGGKTFRLDLYGLYYQGRSEQNVPLQHGDVVNVGEQRFNKVFVLGEVGRPNSITMPRGRMTLAEALSDSGGVNPFSGHAGQIFVIRASDSSPRPQIYHLNASSPDALVLADRFDLRARDVVFVDAVAVVRWARVVNLILPSVDVLRQTLNDSVKGLPR
jgi:polysaccharide export outer membrane protein